jgi:hypothetical protein
MVVGVHFRMFHFITALTRFFVVCLSVQTSTAAQQSTINQEALLTRDTDIESHKGEYENLVKEVCEIFFWPCCEDTRPARAQRQCVHTNHTQHVSQTHVIDAMKSQGKGELYSWIQGGAAVFRIAVCTLMCGVVFTACI